MNVNGASAQRWLMLLTAVVLLMLSAMSVSAQEDLGAQGCIVRTDWPTYTVARGDTLFRIAVRYGTNTSTLAAANCLVNINVIYVGQVLRVPPTGTNPPPSNPPPTGGQLINITYQPFENGFMIWESSNSYITAFIGQNSGSVLGYPSYSYSWLADNPVTQLPPSGRFKPIMGFGKVWGNFSVVRNGLGWATGGEVSHVATRTNVAYGTSTITIPGGGIIQYTRSTWQRLTYTPPPPPPVITPVPPQNAVINAFSVTPSSVLPGQTVSAAWSIQGAQMALIEVYDSANQLRLLLTDLPQVGTQSIQIPPDMSGDARFVLWAAARTPSGFQRYIQTTAVVRVGPSTPATIPAAYQPFERGFMIWRSDTGDVLVFYNSGAISKYPASLFGPLPDNPVPDAPPSGYYKPISGFGRVWGNFPEVRAGLGWGTGPERAYNLTITPTALGVEYSTPEGSTFTVPAEIQGQ